MTMGFEDDGDPPTGSPGVVEDSVEDRMDLEETTVPVVRKSVEKSGSRSSTSRLAHTSTSTNKSRLACSTSTSLKDKDNGQPTRVDDERVGTNLEETLALLAGQSMVKSGSKSLQKKPSRSALAGTSRLANTSTRTMMGSNGHSTGSVDDERVGMEAPVAGQSMEKSGNNSLQKKASRSATSTSRLVGTNTSTAKKTTTTPV
jgi:hypothetical protein